MFEKFKEDVSAKTGISTGTIVGLAVALLVFSAIGITALNSTIQANTTGWGVTNIALYGLIVLAAILAFVYHFLPSEWRK